MILTLFLFLFYSCKLISVPIPVSVLESVFSFQILFPMHSVKTTDSDEFQLQ